MIAFSDVIHKKKTEKIENFQVNFFIFILTYFANHFIPTYDFFTTLPHSYSSHLGEIVLFISHLPSTLETFFYFCQKMTKFFPPN